MRQRTSIRKALATLLSATVWCFCSLAGIAGELSPGSVEQMLAPTAGLSLQSAPRSVTGAIGQISWSRLERPGAAWNCRTGAGSGVTVDLQSAGKVSILAGSNVNVGVADNVLLVTLLGGGVILDRAAPARVETFDGAYALEAGAERARFEWRDGALAITGGPARKLSGEQARMTAAGLRIQPAPAKSARRLAAAVTDAQGRPVAGVPVRFASAAAAPAGFATVLTDRDGIAETSGAPPAGRGEVSASIEATSETAAVPADPPKTGHSSKTFAFIVLGAVAAATIVLAVRAADKDDPKLTPGTPTLVR